MSSRLATGPHGERLAVITVHTLPGLEIGHVFAVLDWCELFIRRGRPPTARERATVREPYDLARAKRERREQVPDEQLDERAALEACRREQQREPVDLIGRAA
jgi:hypothetical protein